MEIIKDEHYTCTSCDSQFHISYNTDETYYPLVERCPFCGSGDVYDDEDLEETEEEEEDLEEDE